VEVPLPQSLLRKDDVAYKITPVSSFSDLFEGITMLSEEAEDDEVRVVAGVDALVAWAILSRCEPNPDSSATSS